MVAPAWAQLKIDTDGHVAIGTTPSLSYKLRVLCSSSTGCTTSNIRAIYATADNDSWDSRAVYAVSTGNPYSSYGVYASASGYNAYGIYATASGSAYNYAGYFNGTVYTTGSYQSSDARLKTDVRSLSGTGMLAKLMQLEPRRYRYRSAEALAAQGLPAMQLPEGEHLGLVAQEVEQVFPALVTDVAHPGEEGEAGERSEAVMTKAINYTELIPVLIGAIQEQQVRIEALEAVLEQHGMAVPVGGSGQNH